jgi:arylsulfatase A-like enzyme
MVAALSDQHLLDSTLVIITAKHGQSPIDTHQVNKFKSTSPAHLLTGLLRPSTDPSGSNIGPTEDDSSLIWLADSGQTQNAVNILEANAPADGVGEIFYGPSLTTMFNSPLKDPRTPDIIVQPNVGVIYSTSGKKQAEHGGFAHDDTNVMLLVSKPGIQAKTLTTGVETTQVAPTILQALGLDVNSLQAVRAEGTQVLPAVFAAGGEGHQNDEQ